jgi:hypothetical protein
LLNRESVEGTAMDRDPSVEREVAEQWEAGGTTPETDESGEATGGEEEAIT